MARTLEKLGRMEKTQAHTPRSVMASPEVGLESEWACELVALVEEAVYEEGWKEAVGTPAGRGWFGYAGEC